MKVLFVLNEEFICAAIEHGAATNKSDYNSGNQAHNKLMKVFRQITEHEDWQKEFTILLSHENSSVKLWSATKLLNYNEALAIDALTLLSKLEDFIGFDATLVIEEWRNGHLKNF